MLRLNGVKIDLQEISDLAQEESLLKKKILAKLRIKESELLSFRIFKKSVDARRKDRISLVYNVDLELANEEKALARGKKLGLVESPDLSCPQLPPGTNPLAARPVIVGLGPAGLFAGLLLARRGYQPIIFERGAAVEARAASIEAFWSECKLDPESNVQFGEGGAGTFSDGKLTTQVNDKRCRLVLEELVQAGAPEETLYEAKPHIGTDLLREIVKNIRKEIIRLGGQVHFRSKVTDFIIDQGQLKSIIINDEKEVPAQVLLLAIGHSARDTYEVLHQRGVFMEQKPFSLGLRIEHHQALINQSQYGDFAHHSALGPAEYKLSYHTLREALEDFGRKIKGFDNPKALLTGIESRSSSPIRIRRDKDYIANIQGIYPLGEGAGYAGGIMSAALDGIKGAEKIIERFRPFPEGKVE